MEVSFILLDLQPKNRYTLLKISSAFEHFSRLWVYKSAWIMFFFFRESMGYTEIGIGTQSIVK